PLYSGAFPDVVPFSLHATSSPTLYTLSLHDALPICKLADGVIALRIPRQRRRAGRQIVWARKIQERRQERPRRDFARLDELRHRDRKSTRLNSSHQIISYAVFCLKKKKHNEEYHTA